MSLKLKPFDIIGSVQNVNNQMKSTPVLINLDDDNNAKSERKDGFYDSNKVIKNKMFINDCKMIVEDEGVIIVKNILNDILDTVAEYPTEDRLIVVDIDGVAVVERENPISRETFEEVYKNVLNANVRESKDDKSIEKNGALTLVLEEDEGPGDVVQVHEIDVDGDLVQVQEIAFGDNDSELDNKLKGKADNGPQDQIDEIVILSDKESDHKSHQEDDIDKESAIKKNIPETVTVLKTPLRVKKNKRLIKSPFSRTNDLLCQKVDKMIRCGKPDIQLLRSLLNHLSENNIGELLAKLVSNNELETMRTNFKMAKVKVEDRVKNEQINNNDKNKKQDDEPTGQDEMPKKVQNVCSKLPDGISIDVVSPTQAAQKEDTAVKTVNSVDMINTIIRSEVSAAVQSSETTPSRSAVPLNIRADSIVELEVTPPPTPEKPDTAVGGLRIANIKNLLAPKDDIIIPEIPIRISNTVSLSKHNEDDDISIIEENLSPVTITRNLPNVSISRTNPPQTHSSTQPRNCKSTEARSSIVGPSKPSSYPKPPNSYYDGRGKLRSSLTHKLLNLDIPSPNQQSNNMPIPMNELIRRYLYPSGSGGVSVGTPMENPWGLPRDLAMYEELLRTNMTSTTDNSQYASYAAAYEELIKSFMSSSPENYAKIVTKYNIFSTDRSSHNDHDRPSTSKLTPPRQTQASRLTSSSQEQEQGAPGKGNYQAGQTSRLSPHQRTPVIVSAASLKSKGQYKECNIGSGVTLTPVQRFEDLQLHPQAGPSGVRDQRQSRAVEIVQSRARAGKKRNYKESSEESTSEESSESDDVPSADEFVVEQAETPRMKAGRSRKRETETPWKRKKSDRRDKTNVRRGEGQGGVSGKRRGKVTAMRHNPLRKGQVTVDSTDSEPESRIRKSNVSETSLKTRVTDGSGSSSNECMDTGNHGFPRKTNINQAALKRNRVESESSEGWKKSGSSEDSASSDDH